MIEWVSTTGIGFASLLSVVVAAVSVWIIGWWLPCRKALLAYVGTRSELVAILYAAQKAEMKMPIEFPVPKWGEMLAAEVYLHDPFLQYNLNLDITHIRQCNALCAASRRSGTQSGNWQKEWYDAVQTFIVGNERNLGLKHGIDKLDAAFKSIAPAMKLEDIEARRASGVRRSAKAIWWFVWRFAIVSAVFLVGYSFREHQHDPIVQAQVPQSVCNRPLEIDLIDPHE